MKDKEPLRKAKTPQGRFDVVDKDSENKDVLESRLLVSLVHYYNSLSNITVAACVVNLGNRKINSLSPLYCRRKTTLLKKSVCMTIRIKTCWFGFLM